MLHNCVYYKHRTMRFYINVQLISMVLNEFISRINFSPVEMVFMDKLAEPAAASGLGFAMLGRIVLVFLIYFLLWWHLCIKPQLVFLAGSSSCQKVVHLKPAVFSFSLILWFELYFKGNSDTSPSLLRTADQDGILNVWSVFGHQFIWPKIPIKQNKNNKTKYKYIYKKLLYLLC